METVMALVIGGLYGAAFYLMMRRSIVKLIFGLALMAHATHLLIFTAGRLVRDHPPLIPSAETVAPEVMADPLPQALILTAIVISFGVSAFALVLVHRVYQMLGTDDLDQMKATDT